MNTNRSSSRRRTLLAETLERRDLLAADLGNQGALAGSGACDGADPLQTQQRLQAHVQTQTQAPLQAQQQQRIQAAIQAVANGPQYVATPRGEFACEPAQVQSQMQSQATVGDASQQQTRQQTAAAWRTSDFDASGAVDGADLAMWQKSFGLNGRGDANGDGRTSGADFMAWQRNEALSADDVEALTFVREEEKLARDVYLTLASQWNLQIFTNIASAEQSHMDAVKTLLDRYGIPDPVVNDAVGEFTNPVLQQLYDDLTSSGPIDLSSLGVAASLDGGGASVDAALAVGAFIEEFDILDIMRRENDSMRTDIATVYENLLRGSRNHLRAFTTQLENGGVVYQPVLMTGADAELGDLDALYVSIINSSTETGGQGGQGGSGSQGGGTQTRAVDQAFSQLGR